MKLLTLLFGITLFKMDSVPLLLIDMDGKKPLRPVTEFSAAQYLTRNFPIYAADRQALIAATEKAAKLIDRRRNCNSLDTLSANHTLVLLQTSCTEVRTVSVRLVTKCGEQGFWCDFEVVRKEQDERTAQRKLLDLSAYLSE